MNAKECLFLNCSSGIYLSSVFENQAIWFSTFLRTLEFLKNVKILVLIIILENGAYSTLFYGNRISKNCRFGGVTKNV